MMHATTQTRRSGTSEARRVHSSTIRLETTWFGESRLREPGCQVSSRSKETLANQLATGNTTSQTVGKVKKGTHPQSSFQPEGR